MNRFKVLFVALFALAATLVVAPSANAIMPVPKNVPVGNYVLCAPGQVNCYGGLNQLSMGCVWNDDSENTRIAFGVSVGTNSALTYQLLLQRHWVYCADASYNRPSTVVVGNGFCMRWIRFVPKFLIPSGQMIIFGVEVDHGFVTGSLLGNNVFRLNRTAGNNYAISVYPCG